MAAARYWRLSRLESYLGEGLSLSDVALYESNVRKDGSATLSSTVAPVSGAMWSGTVTWADPLPPGMSLVWDFGSAQTIDKVGITGAAQETFLHKFAIEYSTDGLVWTLARATAPSSKFQGAGVAYNFNVSPDDPYETSVVLLLGGDGPNGSTAIIDSSPSAKTVIASGNAAISTAQSKYGGASIAFDGSGGYLGASSADFDCGTGPWTIEGFIRYAGTANAYPAVVTNRNGTWSSGAATINIDHAWDVGKLGVSCYSHATGANTLTGATTLTLDTWYHFAVVRDGTSLKLYLNGSQDGSATVSASLAFNWNAGSGFAVGGGNWDGASGYFAGYIDELRVTKGVARYTSNFTPPAAAFQPDLTQFDVTPLRPRLPAVAAFVGSSAIGDTQIVMPAVATVIDIEDGGMYRVTGTVKEKASPTNTPLKRKVRLHREPDGRMVRETWSDASTGAYTFDHIRGDVNYFVTTFDYLHNFRAVIADNLTPEAMP